MYVTICVEHIFVYMFWSSDHAGAKIRLVVKFVLGGVSV